MSANLIVSQVDVQHSPDKRDLHGMRVKAHSLNLGRMCLSGKRSLVVSKMRRHVH
jgi:hypothetical protein